MRKSCGIMIITYKKFGLDWIKFVIPKALKFREFNFKFKIEVLYKKV